MTKHTPGYEISRDGRIYSIASNWRGYGRREMWIVYYAASFIVRGLIHLAEMLFMLLLAVSLSANAAEARGSTSAHHHHRHNNHVTVPMPRERPSNMVDGLDRSRSRSSVTLAIPQAAGTGHAINAIAWWPSTSPWRADEAFSRAGWLAGSWKEAAR